MNDSDSTALPLGRVVATERKPNTPHEFHFWTALDSPVGIGTIIRVEGAHPVNGQIPEVYGIVVEGFSYTDLLTPLHDVLGHDGSPSGASLAMTERAEIRLYTAAVLRQRPEEPLQPVPMGKVYLADENDVAVALRMDGYLEEGSRTGIPIGVYRVGGTEAPIYVDADFLIGPEAAHLNITGVSGLATRRARSSGFCRRSSRTFRRKRDPSRRCASTSRVPTSAFSTSRERSATRIAPCMRSVMCRSARSRTCNTSPRSSPTGSRSTRCARTRRCCTTCRRSPGAFAKCCSTRRCYSTRTTSTPRPTH